ncbi:unnamed protein product [Echinostoma caproni]|uniref:Metallophos domain-containing protein n=1 Tax=Echinostoma caproni TaxID=27848 RepID=A0A183AC86_9TREM|nr:unnamed protein product [Echinostoma caproni]
MFIRKQIYRVGVPLILSFIVGEILQPQLSLSLWPKFDSEPDDRETRLLLIADPHVEGYKPDLFWLNYILQWDSDRYLETYFQQALTRIKPNGFLILGDLFDRGFEAYPSEFDQTCKRFRRIYFGRHSLPYLLIPGDNDVDLVEGGPTDPFSVTRFIDCVGQQAEYVPIHFAQIKAIPRGAYKPAQTHSFMLSRSSGRYLVLATHEPINMLENAQLNAALKVESPCVFVSGHHHHVSGAFIFSVSIRFSNNPEFAR